MSLPITCLPRSKRLWTSELSEEDVQKFPDKEFSKIILKLLKYSERHIQEIKGCKENVIHKIAPLKQIWKWNNDIRNKEYNAVN